MCIVWKMFCFCAQYTFLDHSVENISVQSQISDYSVESVFFCTVHISDVQFGKFCFCAQYTFLVYHPECVLFLFTVHISDVTFRMCCISVHNTQIFLSV